MIKIIYKLLSYYLNIVNTISRDTGGKQSFNIFCYPFKVKITKDQQDFLDTAEQFKLPLKDFEIQAYRWGKGPIKILFVHGWQSNTYRWKKYIQSFDQDAFTIYGFDAPGHGNSGSKIGNVPLYDQSLEVLFEKIGKVEIIIAHSIGSFSTLYHLSKNPTHHPEKMISLAAPFSAEEFIDHFLERLSLSARTIKNFKEYFKVYAGHDISFFNLARFMKKNDFPGLIIHDEKDDMVPVEFAKKLHKLWDKSALFLTQGYGHKLKADFIMKEVNSNL